MWRGVSSQQLPWWFTPAFSFPLYDSMLSRNFPYAHSIDKNTKAHGKGSDLPLPMAQHSSLYNLLPLEKNKSWSLALSSPLASKILQNPLLAYFSNFEESGLLTPIQWSRVSPEIHISKKLPSDADTADPWTPFWIARLHSNIPILTHLPHLKCILFWDLKLGREGQE